MSYFAAASIVVISALFAGTVSFFVDRLVSVEARRKQHDVGFQIFAIIGLMFSVLLAFVFSEVWSQYNVTKEAISAECGALHGAALIANAMPHDVGRPINRNLRDYANDVVRVEWTAMASQRRSIETSRDLRRAIDTAARLPVTSPSDLANRSTILDLLAQAHAARETRIFQLDLGLPGVMWFVLILLCVTLILFVTLAGAEQHATVFFSAIFAASIVMVLVLVRMFDYPFEGALALGNDDFVKLGGDISELLAMK